MRSMSKAEHPQLMLPRNLLSTLAFSACASSCPRFGLVAGGLAFRAFRACSLLLLLFHGLRLGVLVLDKGSSHLGFRVGGFRR